MLQLPRGGTREGRLSIAQNQTKTWKKRRVPNAKMQPGNAPIKNYFFYTLGGKFKIN